MKRMKSKRPRVKQLLLVRLRVSQKWGSRLRVQKRNSRRMMGRLWRL